MVDKFKRCPVCSGWMGDVSELGDLIQPNGIPMTINTIWLSCPDCGAKTKAITVDAYCKTSFWLDRVLEQHEELCKRVYKLKARKKWAK